jgi:superfamily II DNA or RNA helicase
MTAPLVLRPYQDDVVERLRDAYRRGRRAPLLTLPTAAGKTIVFSQITRAARALGRSVLIVVHRRELIHQGAAKLNWAGVAHGIIAAGFDRNPAEPVQVGSVQTLARRALPEVDLLILDEAHHCRADTWRHLIERVPNARLLGVTATPARLDGKGLGITAGGPFDELVVGATVSDLIADGYLAPARCFAPRQRLDLSQVRIHGGDYAIDDLAMTMMAASQIFGDAVEQYRRRADHRPAIVFCCPVAHAEAVARTFRAAGYRSACVHGGTPTAERDALISGLADGRVEVLTNCALIDEGLDVPAVSAVILLRPTKSLVLHRQQIGRGMRPAVGKDALVVNDHVGNCIIHGLPDGEVAWSLAGVEKGANAPTPWECPRCTMLNPRRAPVCAACGYGLPVRRIRELPQALGGELAELTPGLLNAITRLTYRQIMGGNFSAAELRAFAHARGYRPGWVWYRLREQAERAA